MQRVLSTAVAFLSLPALANANDPWTYITWTTDSTGNFQVLNPVIVPGLTLGTANCLDVINHAVVVHDSDGNRVGCGLLTLDASAGSTTAVAEIGAYPGVDVVLVNGTVQVTPITSDGASAISFSASLQNAFADTSSLSSNGFGANQQGGVHIHTGTTCDDANLVGAHHYQQTYSVPTLTGPDYWTDVKWATDGASCMNPQITSLAVEGLYYDPDTSSGDMDNTDMNVDGHAVVVHDVDGTKVGCGVIGGPLWDDVTYSSDAQGRTAQIIYVEGFTLTDSYADTGAYLNANGECMLSEFCVAC